MPKVSVLIPTYNCARYIGQAIQSVLDQTLKDWEIIISDNASTDETKDIIQQIMDNDSRVHYYRNSENIGFTRNVYNLLSLAQGQYGVILCADDVWKPDFLSKCVDIMGRYRDVSFVHTGALVNNYYKAFSIGSISQNYHEIMDGLKFLEYLFGDYNSNVYLSSAVFRLSIIRSIQPMFELKLSTDLYLWTNLALQGKVAYIKEPLIIYSQLHSGSLTWQNIINEKGDNELLLRRVFDLLGPTMEPAQFSKFKHKALYKYSRYHVKMLPTIKLSSKDNYLVLSVLRELIQRDHSWLYNPFYLLRAIIALLPCKVIFVLKKLSDKIKVLFPGIKRITRDEL